MDEIGKSGKEGSMGLLFLVMLASIVIASFWNSLPWMKNAVSTVLNPTAGALLAWNLTYGMIILVFILSMFTTLLQKYATDQKTLKELKDEQKKLHEDLKKVQVGSKEYTEMNLKAMKFIGPMFKLSMRPLIYTAIPLILLFRWFMDYFAVVDFKFFGIFSWFWFYLIGSIIFSSILRKVLKVV